MRLLFVTPTDIADPRGGRSMLARLHHDVLHDLPGHRIADLTLPPRDASMLQGLAGYIDGAVPSGIATTIAALDAHDADILWLDGSNLGRIAQAVKRARPAIRIITFCHNVEARFFWGSLRRSRSPRAAGVLAGNYVAERLAMRHSDDVVALSMRDDAGLRRLYGRGASAILPMMLADQADTAAPHSPGAADAPLLFVGGAFYANQAGIAWFARHVAPRITVPTHVIGQGMAAMRTELEAVPGMRVIGAVDRVDAHYRAARLAIAPIFDGSGMKTKVAEALMFGKHVIGTPEAFSGYADDIVVANRCCTDAVGFVAAIMDAIKDPAPVWDPAMRALYERDHSPAAARTRLMSILGVVDQTSETSMTASH